MRGTIPVALAGLLAALSVAAFGQDSRRENRRDEAAREPDAASRVDQKRSAPFRIKVVSAGIPTLGGTDGYAVRTTYRVLDKSGKALGTAFLGDPVLLDAPRKLPLEVGIEVNGGVLKESFDYPPEMTQDRVKASWDRGRAVELKPKGKTERLAIPAIWVVRPLVVTKTSAYTVEPNPKEGEAPGSTATGQALSYLPDEIRDQDDGVLYANTLVHVVPGRYLLKVNKTVGGFEIAAGEAKLLRFAALRVGNEDPKDLFQSRAGALLPLGAVVRTQWFAVAPGKYGTTTKENAFQELSELAPGGAARLFEVERVFGDKPRLGVVSDDAPKSGGAVVVGLVDKSPAAAAGLKVGDRLVAIDGTAVKSTDDMSKILLAKMPGEEVELSLVREAGRDPIKVKVKLGGE